MKKTTRALKAQETLAIIRDGYYICNGERIDVSDDIQRSVDCSCLYREDEFDDVLSNAAAKIAKLNFVTNIQIENTTVLEGAADLLQSGNKVGCLNFASAKNPGGGFLNGAVAQEESLAVSSSLYASQMKHFELYEYNRSRHTYLYSDHMIYSPDVVVFRDNYGELLTKPYHLSIITSPATNIGAIKVNKPAEMTEVESTMSRRMDKMLALFLHHDIRYLLLGAWGCGVFQNKAEDIARLFATYLKPGRKYGHCFEQVLFAIYDRSKEQDKVTAFRATI